jgi:translation initiation factor IF-2
MASPVAPPPPTAGVNAPKPGGPAAPKPGGPAAPKPAPAAGAAPQANVISSNPPPAEDAWPATPQQEDGPTMAVASPLVTGRPLRDDLMGPRAGEPRAPLPNSRPMSTASPMASTGYRPEGGVDKDAETMALRDDSPLLPSLNDSEGESEETTRAVSREELIRHQDAQFIVGADAMGDEATLAVAPGQIDLGAHGGLAAALAESIRRESQPNMPGAPAFPAPPQGFQSGDPGGYPGMGGGGMQVPQSQPQAQPWGGDAAPWGGEQAPAWSHQQRDPMSGMQQQGYDPMMPGPQSSPGMHGGYPQSGQYGLMQQQGPQGYGAQGGMGQGGYGSSPNMPTAQQPYPMGNMQGGGQLAPMPGQPPPWMQQQPARPLGGLSRSKLTPQLILLVAVGAVCLAIFIIGIVLFVTTKF